MRALHASVVNLASRPLVRSFSSCKSYTRTARALTTLAMLMVAACMGPRIRTSPTQPLPPPQDVLIIPEPTPRAEPRSAKGNPPFYTVLGKRYFVLQTAQGYLERGVASWYGPGFHAESTSNGERYDMYAMTAAHKTLPLPSFVQVTNLRNGKSVTLRVNDRGPFKDGRIIDLSYTAAAKLDILRDGTAFVEVRAIVPGESAPTPAAGASLYVQAGAFTAAENATRLLAQLKSQGITNGFVRQDQVNGKSYYRVRFGPIPSVSQFDQIVARLKSLGVADARLAND